MTGDENGARAEERVHFDLFDPLRVVASVLVIYSHSFPLTGHKEPLAPLIQRTYGLIAVGAFFVMSGFLVTSSWHRQPVARTFVRNRALRIFPGLLMVVLVSVFVLGPVMTDLSAAAYFRARETWAYLGHTATLSAPVQHHLPGVFASNPYPTGVNGSLWTLPYEVLAYVGVLVLGVVGAGRRPGVLIGVAIVASGLHLLAVDTHLLGNRGVAGLEVRVALTLGLFFVVGCLGFVYQSLWRPHLGVAAVAGLLLVIAGGLAGSELAVSVGTAASVLAVGTRASRLARRIRRLGDPSYGTYIWAFPIQQLLAASGVTSAIHMFLLATPLSIAAGYLSWHVVENPVLRLAKKRRTHGISADRA